MPDYAKGSVSIFETKSFQDWIKSKRYVWPPSGLAERDSLLCQFQREGMAAYASRASDPTTEKQDG